MLDCGHSGCLTDFIIRLLRQGIDWEFCGMGFLRVSTRAMSIFGLIFEFRLDAAVGRNQVVSAKLGSVVVVDHPSAEAARHARATLL